MLLISSYFFRSNNFPGCIHLRPRLVQDPVGCHVGVRVSVVSLWHFPHLFVRLLFTEAFLSHNSLRQRTAMPRQP